MAGATEAKERIRPSVEQAASRCLRRIEASFDAASDSSDNAKHWLNADNLSADAANSAAVREKLRARARYEIANNSYACGMTQSLAEDTIGTGPRLQVMTRNRDLNRVIESQWLEFVDRVSLVDKLLLMRRARVADGEAFAAIADGPPVDGLSLDLRVFEADRVTTPFVAQEQRVDGVELDSFGRPVFYHVLRDHPGDTHSAGGLAFDRVPADQVVHWFRATRPEQHRGIPEITPALALYAQLRRYTLAALGAAEVAAVFAAVVQSDAPPGDEADVEPLDLFELERNMVTTLPGGWKLGQLRAEQPATTYREFKREIVGEISRCLMIPINIALGDSSQHNFASGRLDHQSYHRSIRCDRRFLEAIVLRRLFREWFRESALIGRLPPLDGLPRHRWFWDGFGSIDEQKAANAQKIRLETGTTTIADEYAAQGQDWEDAIEQRGEEIRRMKELGIPIAGAPEPPADPDEDPDDTEQDEDAAAEEGGA